jgi:hypothetical protein
MTTSAVTSAILLKKPLNTGTFIDVYNPSRSNSFIISVKKREAKTS